MRMPEIGAPGCTMAIFKSWGPQQFYEIIDWRLERKRPRKQPGGTAWALGGGGIFKHYQIQDRARRGGAGVVGGRPGRAGDLAGPAIARLARCFSSLSSHSNAVHGAFPSPAKSYLHLPYRSYSQDEFLMARCTIFHDSFSLRFFKCEPASGSASATHCKRRAPHAL